MRANVAAHIKLNLPGFWPEWADCGQVRGWPGNRYPVCRFVREVRYPGVRFGRMRVFISSVIQGFELEREAARMAVESLGFSPVMAERLPAQPNSSQKACLDGVAASDCYVGVFGRRYGYVGANGVSVTEEEYVEAQRRGLPVLLFIQEGSKEPAQEAFINRTAGYRDGYFHTKFRSPHELTAQITSALVNLTKPDVNAASKSSSRMRELLESDDRNSNEPVLLELVVVPAVLSEYIDPARLSDRAFRDGLLQPALFGQGAVFHQSRANTIIDGREHVELKQEGLRRRGVSSITVHTDGSLVISLLVEPRTSTRGLDGFLDELLVDQAQVKTMLGSMLMYASTVYTQSLAPKAPPRVLLHAALRNVQTKKFGFRPSQSLTSMDLGGSENNVVVPREPLVVGTSALGEPSDVAGKLTTLFERSFRAMNRYFESQGRRDQH